MRFCSGIVRCSLGTGSVALALACALAAWPSPARAAAAFGAGAAMAKAHALTPWVVKGEVGPIWGECDDNMRTALKDSANFAAVLQQISSVTGTLDSVLTEELTAPQAGLYVYRAICRYSKTPNPLELVFAFDDAGRVTGLWVRPPADRPRGEFPSAFLDYRSKATLRPPFRGEWTVFWGGRTMAQNYHAFTRDQRFAMDLLIFKDGRTHKGEGKACSDYWCYGQPVLAPAAGTVVWAQDSLPDNPPGHMDPAHAVGNAVIIDHGDGEFSLLAHLQPRSLRFNVGDRVPADAEIGLCGNSGNTTEPHIHFHLQNGPLPFDADGLPAQFTGAIVDGKPVERAEPVKGQRVRRAE